MTTKKDNYKSRTEKEGLGLGAELSVGVTSNGMQDPTGEYPKREYNFGSSINKSALGTKVNKLYTGGGEIGVPLNIPEQMPSQYPFNQVDETPSGHVIEMDDTPGGERVLIRHRKGSGVELRADGTVVISALNNKVEVTGGDQTVIVEGHGNLVYNGNLNLKVSGDMNVEVGGNYNVDVAGNRKETTKRNYKSSVTGDTVQHFFGTKTEKTIGNNITLRLSDDDYVVKGERSDVVEGDFGISSGKNLILSGKTTAQMIGDKVAMTGASQLNIQGTNGIIGGAFIRFTGQTYSGALKERSYAGGDDYVTFDSSGDATGTVVLADGTSSQDFESAIFHGSLYGVAKKARIADNANKAITAFAATKATVLGSPPTSIGILKVANLAGNFNLETESGHQTIEPDNVIDLTLGKIPQNEATLAHLQALPLQEISVDAQDFIRDELKGKDHYNNVFLREPSTQEIRSAFRNETSRDTVGTILVAEGKLNSQYKNKIPPKVGRTVGKDSREKYGYTPIGNSIENRGKRFRK